MSINCPACGQIDRVQKVSAIVLAGKVSGSYVSSTESRGVGYGSGSVVLADSSSVTRQDVHLESDLSAQLAPPELKDFGGPDRPQGTYRTGIAYSSVLILGLVVILFCCPGYGLIQALNVGKNFPGYVLTLVDVLLLVACVALMALSILLLRRTIRKERAVMKEDEIKSAKNLEELGKWQVRQYEEYKAARTRWDALYYCARDHGVFDPAVKKFMRLSEMRQDILTGK